MDYSSASGRFLEMLGCRTEKEIALKASEMPEKWGNAHVPG